MNVKHLNSSGGARRLGEDEKQKTNSLKLTLLRTKAKWRGSRREWSACVLVTPRDGDFKQNFREDSVRGTAFENLNSMFKGQIIAGG